MRLDDAGRPAQHQQSLEMIVAADVEATDAMPLCLPDAVRVTAEGEGDPRGMPGQQVLQGPIAAEGVPQQAVQRGRQKGTREAEAIEGRMMRHDDNPIDL